ncbi:MAG TPA: hypothetical protein PLU39_16965 [Armatimonadota bacterium]|nr:hypothetical protein [Armatimonadota bacterium]HOQ29508.1 hypothetical protein [Armatimonadota bacterium]HPO72613.1 hypothetical protein [Armatimonadota bacterium]HPT99554.1 hypothetical protein [Armatimonadota bacterium]
MIRAAKRGARGSAGRPASRQIDQACQAYVRHAPSRLGALVALLVFAAGALGAPARAQSKEESVAQCVAALRARPEDDEAKRLLRRAFTEVYPSFLPADILTFLPLPHQVCEDRATESAQPQRTFFTTGLAFPDASRRQDPEKRQAFNRVLHAYVQEEGGEWRLAFRVLYDAHQEGAEELAPRAMRELLRVRAVTLAHIGDPRRALSAPVDLWLLGNGDGGAEQSGPNLYLHGTRNTRAPLELLRQIAHELGHLIFPAIGPLDEPETWGNGFLGEVLILRWLARAPAPKESAVPAEALAAYVRQEVEPLARAFAVAGWAGFAGEERSAGSLRLLLGMVLHLEDTQGTKALSELMRSLNGTTVPHWIDAARPLLTP